jgi:hypothetical protein
MNKCKNMSRIIGLTIGFLVSISVFGQADLKLKTTELEALKSREKDLVAEIEILKLAELQLLDSDNLIRTEID